MDESEQARIKAQRQEHYQENKVALNKLSIDYYYENREAILLKNKEKDMTDYNKQYYERNKARFKANREAKPKVKVVRPTVTCECGVIIRDKYLLPKHQLTNKHKKRMAINECVERVEPPPTAHVQRNKHRITRCECGSDIVTSNSGMTIHLKSAKHARLMALIE